MIIMQLLCDITSTSVQVLSILAGVVMNRQIIYHIAPEIVKKLIFVQKFYDRQ